MTEHIADLEIFDSIGFIQRMLGDKELALEIMSEFLMDMDTQINTIKQESEGGDIAVLVRLAHTIKGASANVGAKQMQKAALRAEQAAARGDRDQVAAIVPEIEEHLTELKSLLLRRADLNFPIKTNG